jgi:cytochrome c oxidase subunit 2
MRGASNKSPSLHRGGDFGTFKRAFNALKVRQSQLMRTVIHSVVLLLGTFAVSVPVNAAGDVEKGKQLYALCAACHGPNAEGMSALNAPANAGQDPWYMTRQLKNFKAGIRGAHPDDAFGAQMRPMAMVLATDEQIADVVAYITSLDLPDPPQTVDGDVALGKQAYETCIPCHGEFGQGAQSLDAPRLSNQHDWYIVRQIENFIAGIRGNHQNDIYGAQMRIMSQMLESDERIRAVAAYVASLEYQPGDE